MIDEVRFYEFILKLNTYLNRMNVLAVKFMKQEQNLSNSVLKARINLPKEVFDDIFQPLIDELDNRVKLLQEMSESNDEFQKQLTELHEHFKGIVQ